MNDRSRQNPAYRLTHYAPLASTSRGAPIISISNIKNIIYSFNADQGRLSLVTPPKNLSFLLFYMRHNMRFLFVVSPCRALITP